MWAICHSHLVWILMSIWQILFDAYSGGVLSLLCSEVFVLCLLHQSFPASLIKWDFLNSLTLTEFLSILESDVQNQNVKKGKIRWSWRKFFSYLWVSSTVIWNYLSNHYLLSTFNELVLLFIPLKENSLSPKWIFMHFSNQSELHSSMSLINVPSWDRIQPQRFCIDVG
jgi:hypothetical protein